MNLYALATSEHNRRVWRRRAEQFYWDFNHLTEQERYILFILGVYEPQWHKQQSCEERDAEWKRKRAEEKKANRKRYRGSWRQRRGHGYGWKVIELVQLV